MTPRDANESAERRAVLVGEDGLDQWLGSGMCIALGGLATACHAMVAVRHIIRRNLRDLTVIGSAVGGLDVDLLIGAGCVRKVISPYVGAEALANALHITIGSLFTASSVPDRVVVRARERKALSPRQGITYQLLTPDLSGQIEFILSVYEVGVSTGEELFAYSEIGRAHV